MAPGGMIRAFLRLKFAKLCLSVPMMLIFMAFYYPVATEAGDALPQDRPDGAQEKGPVRVKNSFAPIISRLERLKHTIQEELPDLEKLRADCSFLETYVGLMEQAQDILEEGTDKCHGSEKGLDKLEDELSRSKGVLSAADSIRLHGRLLKAKWQIEGIDNAVWKLLKSIKGLSLPKKIHVNSSMLARVEQELAKIKDDLQKQAKQAKSKKNG